MRPSDTAVSVWLVGCPPKLQNVCVKTRRLISWFLLSCAVGAGLTACGSSGGSANNSSSPSSAPAATSAAAPTASPTSDIAADEKAITANWEAFFSPKTPVSQRVALLQDGSQFTSIIQAQAGQGLASEASAKVTKVQVISTQQAAVTYTILLDGQAALKNQAGTAVFQEGQWKVGVASFCGLLTLENSGNTSSLPAACKSAA
jgi:hypothetical protein